MKKNITIIGGGISSLILIKSIKEKLNNKPIKISIYEKKPRLLDFFYKYFSEDSNSKSINKVLLKNLEDVSINLNTKVNTKNIKKICSSSTDVVFSIGVKENILPENINYERSLKVIKEIKNNNKEVNKIKNKSVAIIGCGNVAMDITRGLIKWGVKKVYIFCRSDWKSAKYTNSELEKTVKTCNNNLSIKNFNPITSLINLSITPLIKRRETYLKKFLKYKEGIFNILFKTTIKEVSYNKEGKYKIITKGGEKIKVDRIISSTGFKPLDISPYVNIIERMTNKPKVHYIKTGPINEIIKEANKLSDLLIS